ncbi:acyltransferase [Deltaproteobacteria bacterium IMCC39524]|nr:acyltransferase [Deltaproteobacteria bacterium IMCC39524]
MSAISFEDFQKTKFFPCLDGIRAVAVMWVVFYHCPKLDIPIIKELQGMGDLGVDLFFVLSGFLITTLILREQPASLADRLKGFYWRRALRIFPVYYLAIFVYWLAVTVASPEKVDLYNLHVPSLMAYYIDFKLAFTPQPFPPFGHAWSLSIEEKYYLLWPLVAMVLSRRKGLAVAVGLIVVAIGWRFYLVSTYTGDLTGRLYYSFDTRYDAILWGAVLAYLLKSKPVWDVFGKIFSRAAVFYLVAVLFLVAGIFSFLDNSQLLRYVLAPLFSFVLITCILQRPQIPGCRILETFGFKYVGKVSYGIYIFHPIAISVAIKLGPVVGSPYWVFTFVCGSILSVLLAGASFRFFESPFLKLRNVFGQNTAKKMVVAEVSVLNNK